jgi:hypothetical protein
MTTRTDRSPMRSVLTLLAIGIAAIVALKIAFGIAALVIGLFFTALFTLGPILLVGWIILKALRFFTRESEATAF